MLQHYCIRHCKISHSSSVHRQNCSKPEEPSTRSLHVQKFSRTCNFKISTIKDKHGQKVCSTVFCQEWQKSCSAHRKGLQWHMPDVVHYIYLTANTHLVIVPMTNRTPLSSGIQKEIGLNRKYKSHLYMWWINILNRCANYQLLMDSSVGRGEYMTAPFLMPQWL